jgi:ADP-ribose pyrophosphatase
MPATRVPKHAKRVFKGVIFNVWQWPQKMYDGSTKTFEIITRHHTVVVIPEMNGKIVIIKQQQPRMKWFYSVPAGRMDVPGESPKEAALRELREETGLKPTRMKLWKKIPNTGKVVHNLYI